MVIHTGNVYSQESETVELGMHFSGGNLTEKEDTFQYVLLLKSLKVLLKKQEILDEVCI